MIFGFVQEPQVDLLANDPKTEIAFHLQAMVMADQEVRNRVFGTLKPGGTLNKELFWELNRIDRANTRHLQFIIERHGWLGSEKFGPKIAHDAWLIVQHADLNPGFQRRCLDLMKGHLNSKVEKGDYAYLWDRVAANNGKKQRYGTQFRMENGLGFMKPCEDLPNLDRRRKSMGLVPIREYARILMRVYPVKVVLPDLGQKAKVK